MPSASPVLERMTAVSRRSSCAIRITEPNNFVAQVHGRMSVILDAKDFPQWKQDDIKDAAALMKPASEDLLVKWAVSK
jgi:putative SOS response-associated peptidase YedK